MAFSESIKIQVRQKSGYRCCRCQSIGIEIHHIIPQESGGPDDIDNAAPLCPNCHTDFGANIEKRKAIKEMRDWWYEKVKRMYAPADFGLIENIATQLNAQTQDMTEIKTTLKKFIDIKIEEIKPGNVQAAVSSIVGTASAVVAFGGLQRTVSLEEYETAKKLLKAILQLRDAISFVRNPWIPAAETTKAVEQAKKENPNVDINENRAVYYMRWNKITEALSLIENESLDAEIFWANDVKRIITPLRQCVGKLNAALSQLFNPQLRTHRLDFDDIIYEINTPDKKDNFTKEIDSAVQVAADFLKDKMKI